MHTNLIMQKQSIPMPLAISSFSWLPKGYAHKGSAGIPILRCMEKSSGCRIFPNLRLAGSRHSVQKVSSSHQKSLPGSFLILWNVIIPPGIAGQPAVQPDIPFIISCCFWKCMALVIILKLLRYGWNMKKHSIKAVTGNRSGVFLISLHYIPKKEMWFHKPFF